MAKPRRRTFDLEIAYNGGRFHGWQRQPGWVTAQETLEVALSAALAGPVVVSGASRTDAGVHAVAQHATFRSASPLDPDVVRQRTNAALGPGLVVRAVRHVPRWFHARSSSEGKTYLYLLGEAGAPDVWLDRFAWRVEAPVESGRLREVLQVFTGTHDFTGFASRSPESGNTTCTVTAASVFETGYGSGRLLGVFIEGDRFLRRMVRRLVGAAAVASRSDTGASDLRQRLDAGEPCFEQDAAPARGLSLQQVRYPRVDPSEVAREGWGGVPKRR